MRFYEEGRINLTSLCRHSLDSLAARQPRWTDSAETKIRACHNRLDYSSYSEIIVARLKANRL